MSKLLIVDDEEDIREFARNYFKKRGIDVEIASNGKLALEKANEFKPDLILLDITMEEMTGIEVLKKLREEKNDVKVIMVTGIENEESVNEANSWGVKGYIHKPLVLEELEKIVLAELDSL